MLASNKIKQHSIFATGLFGLHNRYFQILGTSPFNLPLLLTFRSFIIYKPTMWHQLIIIRLIPKRIIALILLINIINILCIIQPINLILMQIQLPISLFSLFITRYIRWDNISTTSTHVQPLELEYFVKLLIVGLVLGDITGNRVLILKVSWLTSRSLSKKTLTQFACLFA